MEQPIRAYIHIQIRTRILSSLGKAMIPLALKKLITFAWENRFSENIPLASTPRLRFWNRNINASGAIYICNNVNLEIITPHEIISPP